MFPESFEQAKRGDFSESSIGACPPLDAWKPQLPSDNAPEDGFRQKPTSLWLIANDGAPVGFDHDGREVTFRKTVELALKTSAALGQRGKQIGQRFPFDCHAVFKAFDRVIAGGKRSVRDPHREWKTAGLGVSAQLLERERELLPCVDYDVERHN
jgi:hypothetical protein